MVKLRPWQVEALAAFETGFERGQRSQLLQAATGTGKTIVLLSWLEQNLQDGQRALVLAHRRELIYQPLEKVEKFFPDLAGKIGIVMADQNDVNTQVVVATVQTLNSSERLSDILMHGQIDLYVVDEAHHDTADTYRFVEERLREANPDLKKIGVTATPTRTDRDGLITRNGKPGPYDALAFRYPVQQAVRDEVLCQFSAYTVGIPISIGNIRETPNGWDDQSLGDILNAENVWDVVLSAWRGELESAPDCSELPTIVFTASVAQAHGGAVYFQEQGINAEAIDGTMSDVERDDILGRFKSGKIKMVFNCAVLTEGFDAPNAACCLMVSPTKSPLIWTQKAGRILRLDPDKPDKHAVIVDFYPIDRAGVFAADALGVPKHISDAKENAEEQGVMIGGWAVDRFGMSTTVDTDQIVFKMLDLMAKSRLPWALDGHIATTTLTAETAAAIVLPDTKRIEKAETLRRRNSGWEDRHENVYQYDRKVKLYSVYRDGYTWRAELTGLYDTPDDAKHVVDDWPTDQLGRRSAGWRKSKASEKQMRYLRRLLPDPPEGLKSGEASRLISGALTVEAAQKSDDQKRQELWSGSQF